MKNYISMVAALALATSLMTGCSDSDGDSVAADTFSGNFVADGGNVKGLSWSCGTKSGTTAADGIFGACADGSTVEFKLGEVALGSTGENATGIYTADDLEPISRAVSALADRIMSALMSADTDPATPGIQMTTASAAAFTKAMGDVDFSTVSDEDLEVINAQSISILAETDPDTAAKMKVVSVEDGALTLEDDKKAVESGDLGTNPHPPAVTGAS